MNSVEISSDSVEPPSWMPDLEQATSQICKALDKESWSVSIRLCTDEEIRDLNRCYRHMDEATDVLTFPDGDEGEFPTGIAQLSGDVAISPSAVEANAREFGVERVEEFMRVYVHALLHLDGYTHDGIDLGQPDASTQPMLILQEEILKTMHKESET